MTSRMTDAQRAMASAADAAAAAHPLADAWAKLQDRQACSPAPAPAPAEPMLPTGPIVHKLASAFINGAPVVPTDRELAMLNAWIDAEFQVIPVPVHFTERELDLPQMLEILRTTGTLLISIAHNSHPFLEGFTNAKFRALHDWHHVVIGADSSFAGEFATFEHARKSAPAEIQWLLFSEIVLQAAACISTGQFQPQKLVRIAGF